MTRSAGFRSSNEETVISPFLAATSGRAALGQRFGTDVRVMASQQQTAGGSRPPAPNPYAATTSSRPSSQQSSKNSARSNAAVTTSNRELFNSISSFGLEASDAPRSSLVLSRGKPPSSQVSSAYSVYTKPKPKTAALGSKLHQAEEGVSGSRQSTPLKSSRSPSKQLPSPSHAYGAADGRNSILNSNASSVRRGKQPLSSSKPGIGGSTYSSSSTLHGKHQFDSSSSTLIHPPLNHRTEPFPPYPPKQLSSHHDVPHLDRPSSARPGSARPGSAARRPSDMDGDSLNEDDIPIISDSDDSFIEERNSPENPFDRSLSPKRGEALSTVDGVGRRYGMTLDAYISTMVTTPASAAATSGLGQLTSPDEQEPYGPSFPQSVRGGAGSGNLSVQASGWGESGRAGGVSIGIRPAVVDEGGPRSPTRQHQAAMERMNSGSRSQGPQRVGGSSGGGMASPSSWRVSSEVPSSGQIHNNPKAQMAFSNNLDLRPSTAAVPASISLSLFDNSVSGSSVRGRFVGHVDVGGDHGDLIKEADLGGMSASLFTPYSSNDLSPSYHSQGVTPLTSSMRMRGAGGYLSNHATSDQNISPSSSGMIPTRGSGASQQLAASSSRPAPLPRTPTFKPSPTTSNANLESLELGLHRTVQSARPVTRGAQELDVSVWQNNINAQLRRPPSRQKPPPEALHLWSEGDGLSGAQDSLAPAQDSSTRSAHTCRPQTAAASTYRSGGEGKAMTVGLFSGSTSRGSGGTGVGALGLRMCPPTRQKPPPLALCLGTTGELSEGSEDED